MPQPLADWTAARVLELPDDGNRYEVVDGELLVTPAPSLAHQAAIQALYERIKPYVHAHRIGRVLLSPADIELDPRTLVQPDLVVAPPVAGRLPRSWAEIGTLLLAVEVRSPATARADRQVKRRRYQRHGVPEYWVVDLDARLVERWRPSDDRPEILTDRLEWRPAGGIPRSSWTSPPSSPKRSTSSPATRRSDLRRSRGDEGGGHAASVRLPLRWGTGVTARPVRGGAARGSAGRPFDAAAGQRPACQVPVN